MISSLISSNGFPLPSEFLSPLFRTCSLLISPAFSLTTPYQLCFMINFFLFFQMDEVSLASRPLPMNFLCMGYVSTPLCPSYTDSLFGSQLRHPTLGEDSCDFAFHQWLLSLTCPVSCLLFCCSVNCVRAGPCLCRS